MERITRYLENHNQDNDSLEEQEKLFMNLPPALRSEVIQLTQKNITKQIHFFNGKNKDFIRRVIPLLKPRKIYRFDSLFSQGDAAEEIYFVLKGSFALLIDIAEHIDCEKYDIVRETESFNVPFNSYSDGSYFGDEDTLCELKQDEEGEQNKRYRKTTSSAQKDTDVMFIKVTALKEQLEEFPKIKQHLTEVANEKINYFNVLIAKVTEFYKYHEDKDKIIRIRLEADFREITTYMSMKRQLLMQNKDLNLEQEFKASIAATASENKVLNSKRTATDRIDEYTTGMIKILNELLNKGSDLKLGLQNKLNK